MEHADEQAGAAAGGRVPHLLADWEVTIVSRTENAVVHGETAFDHQDRRGR
jgi:hypothetical protein